jgi:hypothetical protein
LRSALRKAVTRRKHLAVVFLIVTFSCGYSAGSLLPGHIKKIYIPTFLNETTRYGIEQELTEQVIDAFTSDNRLSVVSEGEADAMLRGVIIMYEKGALTFDRAQTVDEFRIEITVSVEFEDLREGKVIWREDEFRAWQSYVAGETEEGEEGALRSAMLTLANDILSRTVEGW